MQDPFCRGHLLMSPQHCSPSHVSTALVPEPPWGLREAAPLQPPCTDGLLGWASSGIQSWEWRWVSVSAGPDCNCNGWECQNQASSSWMWEDSSCSRSYSLPPWDLTWSAHLLNLTLGKVAWGNEPSDTSKPLEQASPEPLLVWTSHLS